MSCDKTNPLFIFHHTSLKIQFKVLYFLPVFPNVIVLSVFPPKKRARIPTFHHMHGQKAHTTHSAIHHPNTVLWSVREYLLRVIQQLKVKTSVTPVCGALRGPLCSHRDTLVILKTKSATREIVTDICTRIHYKGICVPVFRRRGIFINLLKPTDHVMHQQFNIQQLYVLPTLYLCVLYLSENKQRLLPLTG